MARTPRIASGPSNDAVPSSTVEAARAFLPPQAGTLAEGVTVGYVGQPPEQLWAPAGFTIAQQGQGGAAFAVPALAPGYPAPADPVTDYRPPWIAGETWPVPHTPGWPLVYNTNPPYRPPWAT